MNELYKRTNYLNKEIDYLFNCDIYEYDLASAGLSLIKEFKLADDKTIHSLEQMDKEPRNKEIGMMQKDKQFARALLECFTEARHMFFEANHIQEYEILTIKKDAVFVVGRKCEHSRIGKYLNFRIKNQYLGYMHLNGKEFYFKDPHSDLDVKGLGPDVLYYHGDYILDFIKDVFCMAIYSPRKKLIEFITRFISDYRHRNLAYGYYRNLDSESFYTVIDDEVGRMNIKDIDDNENVNLDITYNYFKYLIPIVGMIL